MIVVMGKRKIEVRRRKRIGRNLKRMECKREINCRNNRFDNRRRERYCIN